MIKRKMILLILVSALCACDNDDVATRDKTVEVVKLDSTPYSYKIVGTDRTLFPTDFGYQVHLAKELSSEIKMFMIEDLLSFGDDERICAIRGMSYNPKYAAGLTPATTDRYSIQVEALFIINILFCNEPFEYSPTPILGGRGDEFSSINGVHVEEAYIQYRKWFELVSEMGYEAAQDAEIMPLDNSSAYWYH
jgi:hypothetical protein